ncbi:hypothetical protein Glove_139g114 [Diversispora epigaea]|uniref:Uncharacterized protein n=1 Tax=Diversispora epigaea TaxID=1348612 RepID=A0A397IZV2_9GLOM|nr:hypothetical protein Glove_139g114 [Diversispora epigaea]
MIKLTIKWSHLLSFQRYTIIEARKKVKERSTVLNLPNLEKYSSTVNHYSFCNVVCEEFKESYNDPICKERRDEIRICQTLAFPQSRNMTPTKDSLPMQCSTLSCPNQSSSAEPKRYMLIGINAPKEVVTWIEDPAQQHRWLH